MFIWDEKKRQANLVKHNLDFVDAPLVYDSPASSRKHRYVRENSAMSTQPSLKSTAPVSPSPTPVGEQTSVSSPSDHLPEESGCSSSGLVSQTDWEYIRWMQKNDIPIPYDPNDPDETPYDPNDSDAVDRFWDEGERLGLVTRGLTLPAIARDRKLHS